MYFNADYLLEASHTFGFNIWGGFLQCVGTSHNSTDNPYSFNQAIFLLQPDNSYSFGQTVLTPSIRQSLLPKSYGKHRYLYTTNQPISVHNSSINTAKTPIGSRAT
jgi:hypothetical protein